MSEETTECSVDLHDLNIFNKIKNLIREKINQIDKHYCDSLPQKKEIAEMIRKVVQFHESTSFILCGPPGCGKTTLVKHVISKLREENIINDENTLIVHLNGLLHTDDRLAFKDIIKQLHLGEKFNSEEYFSFQESLIFLFNKLRSRRENENSHPSVVFILDEFHLFCEHKNQILLYNLFDLVQSTPSVCVMGLTYYSDVMDLFEKRVLSRFSHRIIWMENCAMIDERLQMFSTIFSFNEEDLFNIEKIYKILWNARVQDLVKNKEVIDTFKQQLELLPSLNNFKNFMFKLLNTVTFEKPLLTAESIKYAYSTLDYYISILGNLSMLEMALVLVIKHQYITYDKEPFNFEMIYSQYLNFTRRHSTTLLIERCVVLKGFQKLEEFEIIVPIKQNGVNKPEKTPLEYRLYNFTLTSEQVSEGFKLNKELPTNLTQWLTSIE